MQLKNVVWCAEKLCQMQESLIVSFGLRITWARARPRCAPRWYPTLLLIGPMYGPAYALDHAGRYAKA